MEPQPHKGLTIIQWLSLVALLGVVLTIAAWLWSGPSGSDSAGAAAETQQLLAESQ